VQRGKPVVGHSSLPLLTPIESGGDKESKGPRRSEKPSRPAQGLAVKLAVEEIGLENRKAKR